MNENKQLICDLLAKTLQATRGAHDLVSLTYNKGTEYVTAIFEGGRTKIINVAMDSETAMIRDILRNLGV